MIKNYKFSMSKKGEFEAFSGRGSVMASQGDIASLIDKIEDRTARISVLGLGYVGLPLAIHFACSGFRVVGVEIDIEKVARLKSGRLHIKDARLRGPFQEALESSRLTVTQNGGEAVSESDVMIICVPTPVDETNTPDLSYIVSACDTIRKNLKRGSIVILESTTYPGTTNEVVKPILEKDGLIAGRDFGLVYSPERTDPGSPKYNLEDIPKVVGGVDKVSTEVAAALYKTILSADIIKVRNVETAEATKIFENIFRSVNIALVNEIALLFEKMGLDTYEVIRAASTKPFAFMPHYPGPGVGGHCIPVDPFYLSHRAKKFGFRTRFIELAGEINAKMPDHVIQLILKGLNFLGKSVKGTEILVMGVAYKGDIDDTRNSPAIPIIRGLVALGAHIAIFDPYVESLKVDGENYSSTRNLKAIFSKSECVLILTAHRSFKDILMKLLEASASKGENKVIFDTCNLLNQKECERLNHKYVGLGKGQLLGSAQP